MSTAQLLRPQEKTGTWSSIFPNEQVTEQQSALFVKKLLAVAISNVTYLRAIFPEHAFGDRCLEDLNLKILRDDSACPGACQVIKWVKGCFDALDKKYLRMLVIGIYVNPEDPETVIESYTFKFFYTKEGGIDIYRNSKIISSAYTASETKKATIRLLRTIVVLTQTLKSLPDDVMMSMKLLYYDDVTPPDYEPPGFQPSDTDVFKFEEEATNIKVGDVVTPFHVVKMRIKTDSKQFEMKDDLTEEERKDVENDSELSQEISNNGLDDEAMEVDKNNKATMSTFQKQSEASERIQISSENDLTVPDVSPAKPSSACNNKEDDVASHSSDVPAEEFKVRCPCGCNEDDGIMIMCAVCKFWQHGVCFLVLDENEAPAEHFCDVCATKEKACTDPQLSSISSIEVQSACLWRRALQACTEMNRVLAPPLARRLGIEVTVAQGLINRLDKEKYVRNAVKGKKLGKIVDKTLIKKEGIPKYFTKAVNIPSEKSEMEVLTEKTEGITLSGRSLRSKDDVKGTETESKTCPHPNDATKKRGRKRAFSKVDHASEFELCNSQEKDESQNVQHRKKKVSVVTKPIMV